MKIKRVLLNNIGIKLLALLLAFVTWLYVGEATKEESGKTVLQKLLSPASYVSKKLYIKPVFVNEVPAGYEFLKDEVKVTPEFMVVIGPSNILSEKEFIYTMPIDLREYTKSKILDVELERISRSIRFQKTKVQVCFPVRKIGEEKTE